MNTYSCTQCGEMHYSSAELENLANPMCSTCGGVLDRPDNLVDAEEETKRQPCRRRRGA